MIRPSRVFTVSPTIPAPLVALNDLAANLRWTWDPETVDLFRRLDRARWSSTNHNPVMLLRTTDQARLDEAARDPAYRRELAGAAAQLATYLEVDPSERDDRPRVAYFSAEFGLAECLPIYSGGLGVLAGDHLKSASELGLALIGVGLFYRNGYFQQRLTLDGWQEEIYPDNDPATLPIRPAADPSGKSVEIAVRLPGRDVVARVWEVQVGRIPLYLLDTDVEANQPADREITSRLYGGDRDMRIRQELVLGIGGVRALDALGRRPEVCHLNEGHSAFLTLERIRQLMVDQGLGFAEARTVAAAGLVFTTHTPVAAGHDAFDGAMIDHYLGEYYSRELGLSREQFMALGRLNAADETEPFSLTILSLRLAARSNGVSRLHGQVSRRIWSTVWPDLLEEEVPIDSVTNGVHLGTWVAPEFAQLHQRIAGASAWDAPAESAERARAVEALHDRELWERHERLRGDLVRFVRFRVADQLTRQGAGPVEIGDAAETLDPRVLTIGFGRRFAEYKRATLLLRDPARLARLVNDKERPVQIIFTGKAHPADTGGKALIQNLYGMSRGEELRGRVVLLEGYDIGIARRMVRGVDIWLNTPRRPMEASGTSGMKAAANGGLHVSPLDGWWDEGYRPGLGWAIGDRRTYADPAEQDAMESGSLYDLLEREIVPLFYDRDASGLPRGWITRMRAAMTELPPVFNTDRMVSEYATRLYEPAARDSRRLGGDNLAAARELTAWLARVEAAWPNVRVAWIADLPETVTAGASLDVEAEVQLGSLRPDEVDVKLALGPLDESGMLVDPTLVPLVADGRDGSHDGAYCFAARGVRQERSGRQGYAVRVAPHHPTLPLPPNLALARWSD
jgi:starch phosphorylase